MYKKILMAFNASREGRAALLESAEIAAFIKAETHLLAVAGMPPSLFMTGFLPEEVLEEGKKHTQEILEEGIKLLQEQGFNTTGHLTVGEPVEEICRVAAELGADLIVLGHRQRLSFAARWWKGSVGASLLDIAPCSILIARAGAVASQR
jgi:nucleotide-binding universal stress UspA family protein